MSDTSNETGVKVPVRTSKKRCLATLLIGDQTARKAMNNSSVSPGDAILVDLGGGTYGVGRLTYVGCGAKSVPCVHITKRRTDMSSAGRLVMQLQGEVEAERAPKESSFVEDARV